MDYIEKLEKKSSAARKKAERYKNKSDNNSKIAYDNLILSADKLEAKAGKYRTMRQENPKKYLRTVRAKKVFRGIGYTISGFFALIIVMIFFIIADDNKKAEKNRAEARKDSLGLGQETLRSLIGKPVPYENWEDWGTPETLEGTNNQIWVAYLPKANVTFVSEKATDTLYSAGFGKLISDVDDLIQKAKSNIFDEEEGLILCGHYFDSLAQYKGSKYRSMMGRGQTIYDKVNYTVTFFVEAIIVNAFGAKRKAVTSCTVDMSYRMDRDGGKAFQYVKEFEVQ